MNKSETTWIIGGVLILGVVWYFNTPSTPTPTSVALIQATQRTTAINAAQGVHATNIFAGVNGQTSGAQSS